MAAVVKNVFTHANVPGGSPEDEIVHGMQEFVKFSEYNIVNGRC
jgi:hypothetical protein